MENEKRRKVSGEVEAKRLLDEAKAHGVTLSLWCQLQGVDGRSLNAWRVALLRRGRRMSPKKAAKLVELVPSAAGLQSARYTVCVSGVTVEVGDDFQESTLRRILGVLRGC